MRGHAHRALHRKKRVEHKARKKVKSARHRSRHPKAVKKK